MASFIHSFIHSLVSGFCIYRDGVWVVDIRNDSIALLDMGYVRAYFFDDTCCVDAQDEGVFLDVGAELGGSIEHEKYRSGVAFIILSFGLIEWWWRKTYWIFQSIGFYTHIH